MCLTPFTLKLSCLSLICQKWQERNLQTDNIIWLERAQLRKDLADWSRKRKKFQSLFCRKGLKVFHLKPVIFKVCHEDLVFTWMEAEQFLLAIILSFPTFCVGISQQNQQSFSFLLLSLWHQFWKVCLVGKKNFSWWFSNVKSNSY